MNTLDNVCKHDMGFYFLYLGTCSTLPPGIWMCNRCCGHWEPFDPETAGLVRSENWKELVMGYLTETPAGPSIKFSPGGKF